MLRGYGIYGLGIEFDLGVGGFGRVVGKVRVCGWDSSFFVGSGS